MVYRPLQMPTLPLAPAGNSSSDSSQDNTLFGGGSDGVIWSQTLWGGFGDLFANGSGPPEDSSDTEGGTSDTQQDIGSQDAMLSAGGGGTGTAGTDSPEDSVGGGSGGAGAQSITSDLQPASAFSAGGVGTVAGSSALQQEPVGGSGGAPATPPSIGFGSPTGNAASNAAPINNLALVTNFIASSFPAAGSIAASDLAPIASSTVESNLSNLMGAVSPLPQSHG